MAVSRTTSRQVRAEAVRQLVDHLECVVARHRETERSGRPPIDDAELVTAEVAACLAEARAAIGNIPAPH